MRLFRVAYVMMTLTLFLSLVVLGVVTLLRPDLAAEYGIRVVVAIVGGAVLLLVLDLAARRMK